MREKEEKIIFVAGNWLYPFFFSNFFLFAVLGARPEKVP